MKHTAMVSIIIPVFNGSNYLQEAIDSALAQTYKNCEVLVVNDGSNDSGKTEAIAQAYGSKIRYFYKENGGVASAINTGIKNMKGDYFAWLSHDDLFKKDKIEKQLAALSDRETNKNASVFGNFTFWNIEDNSYSIFNLEDYCDKEKISLGIYPVLFGLIHFSTMLVPKSRVDEVGLCDESLKTTQDIEWAFRILRNTRSVFIREPLTIVRRHSEQGKYHIAEYNKEQGYTHIDFLGRISSEEICNLFGSKRRFLLKMMNFYKRDGNYEAYDYAKKELLKITNQEELLEEFKNVRRELFNVGGGKNICIFGAGKYGRIMLEEMRFRGIKVRCFVDNSPEKWGKNIEGIECISPMNINEDDLVIIAIKRYDELWENNSFAHVLTYTDVYKIFEETM